MSDYKWSRLAKRSHFAASIRLYVIIAGSPDAPHFAIEMFRRLSEQWCWLLSAAALALMVADTSVAQSRTDREPGWFHRKYGWEAEKYYDDPVQIELCHAILANDLEGIDKAVADGADVNARGKGGMTPLLWSYAENNPERLLKLLQLGADPNATWESDFNTRNTIVRPGDAITQMVCDCSFDHYFDHVFDHGGDPNLTTIARGKTPLATLLSGSCTDKSKKLKRLVSLGASVDDSGPGERSTPVELAVLTHQYDLALELLEAGADFRVCDSEQPLRVIHLVYRASQFHKDRTNTDFRRDLNALVHWLDQEGETLEAAAKDKERWLTWRKLGRKRFNIEMKREAAEYLAELEEHRSTAGSPD